jgi:hypothetical protein
VFFTGWRLLTLLSSTRTVWPGVLYQQFGMGIPASEEMITIIIMFNKSAAIGGHVVFGMACRR